MSAQGFETKILASGGFPSFDPPDYWWQASDASCAFQIYRYRHHQHSNWKGGFTEKWNQLNIQILECGLSFAGIPLQTKAFFDGILQSLNSNSKYLQLFDNI